MRGRDVVVRPLLRGFVLRHPLRRQRRRRPRPSGRVSGQQPRDEVLGVGGDAGEVLGREGEVAAEDVVHSFVVRIVEEGGQPAGMVERG